MGFSLVHVKLCAHKIQTPNVVFFSFEKLQEDKRGLGVSNSSYKKIERVVREIIVNARVNENGKCKEKSMKWT